MQPFLKIDPTCSTGRRPSSRCLAVRDGEELLSGKSGDLHTHALINMAEFIETGESNEMTQYCNCANVYSMFLPKQACLK
jgi:hypothetical protein